MTTDCCSTYFPMAPRSPICRCADPRIGASVSCAPDVEHGGGDDRVATRLDARLGYDEHGIVIDCAEAEFFVAVFDVPADLIRETAVLVET